MTPNDDIDWDSARLTPEQRESWRRLFERLDADPDDFVPLEDL